MSGPASPGQQVWIGSRAEIDVRAFAARFPGTARSRTVRGAIVEHLLQQRQLLPGIAQPLRRLGLLQIGEQLARARAAPPTDSRAPCRAPRAAACRTDWRAPESSGPSASRTAAPGRPPSARGRRSRSSRAADRLPTAMRFSSPSASSCAMKVAQVAYFIALTTMPDAEGRDRRRSRRRSRRRPSCCCRNALKQPSRVAVADQPVLIARPARPRRRGPRNNRRRALPRSRSTAIMTRKIAWHAITPATS